METWREEGQACCVVCLTLLPTPTLPSPTHCLLCHLVGLLLRALCLPLSSPHLVGWTFGEAGRTGGGLDGRRRLYPSLGHYFLCFTFVRHLFVHSPWLGEHFCWCLCFGILHEKTPTTYHLPWQFMTGDHWRWNRQAAHLPSRLPATSLHTHDTYIHKRHLYIGKHHHHHFILPSPFLVYTPHSSMHAHTAFLHDMTFDILAHI